MHFAGMSLTIRDDARSEIQKDVDALARPGKYFDMKVERARAYFPIIEKIFKEERLPEDFKFLALQESALVPDAVSTSNAVGFWQFKDFTATQMGLRVDSEIDERMNIVSASRGAAKYLKTNNYNFNNWVLALQSYQMGAGGVIKMLGDQFNGMSHMEITTETYWYVKKFIAHKVAFENALNGKPSTVIGLYETSSEKHIKDIAGELSVDADLLQEYNKWIRKGKVPGDRSYFLVVPNGTNVVTDFNSLTLASNKASKATPQKQVTPIRDEHKKINGVEAILAGQGESLTALAARANVSISSFIKYNDITIDHPVKGGEFYFIEKKKKKSDLPSIRTKLGEDLWALSQKYGVRLKSLRKLNPDLDEKILSRGTYVRLNSSAQEQEVAPVQIADSNEDVEVAELSGETFAWAFKPSEKKQVGINYTDKEKLTSVTNLSGTPESLPATHVVKSGETLYSISQTYSIPVTTLVAYNQLNPDDVLKPGQEIQLKKTSTSEIETVTKQDVNSEKQLIEYEVKSSDTLYSVARQFGITIKELMDWNNKTTFNLSKGEKLKIFRK
jgi:membrane-bound lytic murein transglycosylase D